MSAMSPATTTPSTPWSRNHSRVRTNVSSLLADVSRSPGLEWHEMWMSETTPNMRLGRPSAWQFPTRKRLPPKAPNDTAPPMNHRRDMLAMGFLSL